MKQLYFRVTDPNGFHVRPAYLVAECLKKYRCDAFLEYGRKIVKGKDMVGMIKMDIHQGELILFSLRGEEEEEACRQLEVTLKKVTDGELRFT
jgi:phosphocarrier protein HPr